MIDLNIPFKEFDITKLSRQSQHKIKKRLENKGYLGSSDLSDIIKMRESQAIESLKPLLALSKKHKEITNILVGVICNNPTKEIVPSQGWMARASGSEISTANLACKKLNKLGAVVKKDRGYRVGCFKNTLSYSIPYSFKKKIKYAAKSIRPNHSFLSKLNACIPALRCSFLGFAIYMSIFSYSENIKGLNRDYVTNNRLVQREDYLKVNEIYAREPTLPVDDEKTYATILSMVPKPNIGDINAEETCVEHNQYTAENVGFLKLLLWGDRTGKVIGLAKYQDSLKGRNTDLAHCDDATYKTLGYEDKKIVDGYTNYRRFGKYKTRVAYEESLIIRGLEGLISYTADLASQLTKIEIKFIKSFTVAAIDSLKQALRIFPRRKTDFEWILEFLTETSGMTVHETRALLRKHGFTGGRLLREAEKQEYVVKRGKSKVWKPEPRTMSKPESPEKYQASDAFTRLIGQDLDEKLKNKFASNSRV